jgi:hypothetical protein
MTRLTKCADNLILLGEMIQISMGYIKNCQRALAQEEPSMLELAYGEIAPLRKEVAKLDSNLRSLQLQLRDLMKQSGKDPHARGAAG